MSRTRGGVQRVKERKKRRSQQGTHGWLGGGPRGSGPEHQREREFVFLTSFVSFS